MYIKTYKFLKRSKRIKFTSSILDFIIRYWVLLLVRKICDLYRLQCKGERQIRFFVFLSICTLHINLVFAKSSDEDAVQTRLEIFTDIHHNM
jgi:hypothetical protein